MLENKQKGIENMYLVFVITDCCFSAQFKGKCVPTLEVTQEDFLCGGFAFETQDYICIVTCEREMLKSLQLVFDLLSHL